MYRKIQSIVSIFLTASPYNMTTERTKTMVNSTALCPRIFKSTNTHGSNESTINVKQTTGWYI